MGPYLHSPRLLAVLLIAATALIYAPTLGYPRIYEDNNDPGRAEWSALSSIITNPLRTVTEVSYEVARAISGPEPWGDHLVNVALHLVNTALVGVIAAEILAPLPAVLAMAVFALHPLQTEAVAYVSGRADLLACCGFLLALCATLRGSLTGACLGLLFAGLSKESALLAGPLVCVWAWVAAPTFPLRKLVMILAGAATTVVIVFWFRMRLEIADLHQVGRTAWSVLRLTALVFVPYGQSIDHDWHGAGVVLRAVSVGMVAGLTSWAIGVVRSSLWALPWLLAVIWFLPRFVVRGSEGLHEHHMYVVMSFWALCAGAVFSSQLEPARSY